LKKTSAFSFPEGAKGDAMRTLTLTLFSAVAIGSQAGRGSAPVECSVLALQQKAPSGTTLTAAAVVAAAGTTPEYCRVDGHAATPGNTVNFRLGLPLAWNGKFLFEGVGGFAGTIGPLNAGLQKGYASASTDTGHQGSVIDASWALNNPAKRIDYAYRGTHVAAVAAGPGPNTFDMVSAFDAWVDRGTVPSRVVASHASNWIVDRTRPLCPYPQVAAYLGRGSVDQAENFQCAAPGRAPR